MNNAASVTLAGGRIQRGNLASEGTGAVVTNGGTTTTGTNSAGLGMLTLTANSSLDFNSTSANDRGTLFFGAFLPNGFTLTIDNWSSSSFGNGNSGLDGDDRLIFQSSDGNALTSAQLAAIVFSNGGTTSEISLGNGFYEVGAVAAVPESSTAVSGIILAAIGGLAIHRRRRAAIV